MAQTICSGGLISCKIIACAILSGAIRRSERKNEEMYFSHFEEIIQIARYLFNANTFLTHLVEILCFSVLLAGRK